MLALGLVSMDLLKDPDFIFHFLRPQPHFFEVHNHLKNRKKRFPMVLEL